jgi:hypothetical protein
MFSSQCLDEDLHFANEVTLSLAVEWKIWVWKFEFLRAWEVCQTSEMENWSAIWDWEFSVIRLSHWSIIWGSWFIWSIVRWTFRIWWFAHQMIASDHRPIWHNFLSAEVEAILRVCRELAVRAKLDDANRGWFQQIVMNC